MKKNISVLHPITRLIVGGAQENTISTAALLDKQRFAVEILSGPQTGSEGSLIEEVQARGISLMIEPNLIREINPIRDFRALWHIAMAMRKYRYEIVHTHSSKAGIIGRLAARLAGIPIILHTVHGWSFHEHMSPLLRSFFIFLERFMASFTDILIAVSQKDIDKGIKNRIGTKQKYRLIRSAISLEEFNKQEIDSLTVRRELGIPSEAVVIGNVGRFSPQKNPLDWIHIAAKVNHRFPDTFFLLVGDGPLRSQVEALLKSEGIINRTILTGIRRDVVRMLAVMDIFMLTSLWEGLPRTILQAFAMSIPVIAYQIGGISELVRDNITGYTCPPGDHQEMASRCRKLIENPELRARMGKHGRELAENEFEVGLMIKQIYSLYEELLSSKGLTAK